MYRAARLWNPMYAAKFLDVEEAHALIDNICIVPVLNDDELIQSLKSTFV